MRSSTSLTASTSPNATATAVSERRRSNSIRTNRCDTTYCATARNAYAAAVDQAAAIIPCSGTKIRFSTRLSTAARPAASVEYIVRLLMRTPIDSTCDDASATAASVSGPTATAAPWNSDPVSTPSASSANALSTTAANPKTTIR